MKKYKYTPKTKEELKALIKIEKWNTSKVTTMAHMFSLCRFFNQDISRWDTSKVGDMDGMFDGCYCFNQDLSSWDVSGVHMFNKQDPNSWDVTDKRFNFNKIFAGVTPFVKLSKKERASLVSCLPSKSTRKIEDMLLDMPNAHEDLQEISYDEMTSNEAEKIDNEDNE
ncbi:BspA family leucine-rich repeat surface protein [Campylobacter coli]|uniref:BspA family leucine-rich repeat surface protein n=1 Tax=Campylobacter coli TaxID=195 RepID=UPI000A467E8C|nr:BspA family leucine-rich repeat surface protein [Campylobacter coli]